MTGSTSIKKLYKSRTDRMIDGVCGGVAKYFELDPTLVRIAWVVLTFLGGSGILLYIIAMIIMPKEPFVMPVASASQDSATGQTAGRTQTEPSRKNSNFWGILLIVVGAVLFLHNMGFAFWHHWWWFDADFVLSLLLILVGVAFLWGGRNSLVNSAQPTSPVGEPQPSSTTEESFVGAQPRRVYRSFMDSKLFGVCGGLADYFSIDSTIVRILFVAAAIASSGIAVIAYIIMAIIIPKEIPTLKPL